MKAKRLYILLLLLLTTLAVSAQKDFFLFKAARAVKNYVDSSVIKTADSSYIVVPKKPWQLIVRHKIDRMGLKMHSVIDTDEEYMNWTPYVGTRAANSLGLWFGYRGYGLGYSVNLNKRSDTYFTIGAVGSSYGINLRLRTFGMTEFNGDIYLKTKNPDQELLNGNYDFEILEPIRVHSLIIDGYYMFNHKHFSYAAAYDQSAGAFKVRQGSIGAGYAYNWVPTRGLLINGLFMPMLALYNRQVVVKYKTEFDDEDENYDAIYDEEETTNWSRVTLTFNARASVTYSWKRFFLNVYGQWNTRSYKYGEEGDGRISDWYVNTSFGLRF